MQYLGAEALREGWALVGIGQGLAARLSPCHVSLRREVLEFVHQDVISRLRRSLMRIKPSTAIRQDYTGISELCHSIDEPVVLTRNGEADLVVMSYEAFQRAEARIQLQTKLLEAQRSVADGEPLVEVDAVVDRILDRLGDDGE